MNNLIIVGIALTSVILATPLLFLTQEAYGKDSYGFGYDDVRQDRINGNIYNVYAAGSWEDDRDECYANGGYWKHNFCAYD